MIEYRIGPPPPGGVGVVDARIVGDRGVDVMAVDELRIPGRHNVSNALAAVATALHFGVKPQAVRRAAAAFTLRRLLGDWYA